MLQERKKHIMAPTEVNLTCPKGGGGGIKALQQKKPTQLGFSQGKVGSALKATKPPPPPPSKKKQRLHMPGQDETNADIEDNEGGGRTSAAVTDMGPEVTTPRRGSSLPPSCGWAGAHAHSREG
jgi:hypothetical protein